LTADIKYDSKSGFNQEIVKSNNIVDTYIKFSVFDSNLKLIGSDNSVINIKPGQTGTYRGFVSFSSKIKGTCYFTAQAFEKIRATGTEFPIGPLSSAKQFKI